MQITAFIGSPRKEGNTDILVESILDGARSKGAATEKIFLYDLAMSGCIACEGCKRGDRCVLNDDMTPLYDLIQESDVVILASPIYIGRISGPLKSFFDRWYAFMDSQFNTRITPLKKIVAVTVYAAPEGMFKGEADYILSWCERWGMIPAGSMEISDVAEIGAIKNKAVALQEARALGESLVTK